MKKNIFLITCLALLSLYSKGQYFRAKYVQDPYCGGTGMNGMTTKSTGPGHVLGGLNVRTWNSGACNDWAIFVTRTNEQGDFNAATNFSWSYLIYDSLGNQLRVSSSQVVEYADSSGYGVIFTYYPQAEGISCGGYPGNMSVVALGFLRLDSIGTALKVCGYSIPIPGNLAYITGIRESVNAPGDLLATGQFSSGEDGKLWAIRVKKSGLLVWGRLCQSGTDNLAPADIIDQAYYPEVVVVGTRTNPSGLFDGFMLHLNINTGATAACGIYDEIGQNDGFHAITVCHQPGNLGYAIAGVSRQRPWLVKTDFVGSINWWQLYGGYTASTMYGIAERFKAPNTYEYYLGGTASSSKSDVIVLRVNSSGNPINPAIFQYDMYGKESLQSLDLNTSGTYDGISMYGVVEGTPPVSTTIREGFIIKAYFNGILNCDERVFNASLLPSQLSQNYIGIATYNIGPAYKLDASWYPNTDVIICNTDYVASGSNGRQAVTGIEEADTPEGHNLRIFPNPSNGNEALKLDLLSQTNETVQIKVTNLLGAVVASQSAKVEPGTNHLTLDFKDLALAGGMYQVSVEGQDGVQTQKLVIDKAR